MEQVRSFIAVELPDGLRSELEGLEYKLKGTAPLGIKWIKPHSIHLTLKFLGNIATDRIDEITEAMTKATMRVSPFQLTVKDAGAFPNLLRPQVVWVGMHGDTNKLGYLQKQIEVHLTRLGFTSQSRRFTPHLTLARLQNQVSPKERQKFGQLIANTNFEAICKITVSNISLMRSQLTRERAIYNRIEKVYLKQP